MYKRPSIDEDLYYQMAEDAAKKKQTVKEWLARVIKKELVSNELSRGASQVETINKPGQSIRPSDEGNSG